jgi:photosystem II oxygen-evolving enhancer protein 2
LVPERNFLSACWQTLAFSMLVWLFLWCRLEKLGDPEQAGTTILLKSIAPEGSNKVAKLINASRRDDTGVVYYTLEYTVQGPLFFRHNVAVYAVNNGELYSLNAQTSETAWPSVQEQFRNIANSFRLLL